MVDESKCFNCGRCCILKVRDGDYYRLTGKDCQFLVRHENGKTSCFVYPDRLSLKLGSSNICVPIEKAIGYGDLPEDCPYVIGIEGYKTKVLDWMDQLSGKNSDSNERSPNSETLQFRG